MIAWLNPAALAALVALGGPIVVHLLRRQSAARLPFPSVRFIQPSRAAAIRVRLPSDVGFLAARLAILALAALALAQPLLVTPARIDAWNAKVVRAVAIDASDSMRVPNAAGRTPLTEARARADEQSATGLTAARIEHPDLQAAIRQAVAALSAAPPGRRELIVISDFQEGTLSAEDLRDVPAAIGLTLVRVGDPAHEGRFEGDAQFGTDRLSIAEVELSGAATGVKVVAGSGPPEGLRIVGVADADLRTLVETVADAGAPAPSPAQPITIAFAAGSPADASGPGSSRIPGWALETTLRLQADSDLRRLAPEASARRSIADAPSGLTLYRGRDGRPLLRSTAAGGRLILDAAVDPASLFAAAVVRGALHARRGAPSLTEHEILPIPAATLAAWSRPPGAVADDAWRRGGVSDARWCWGALLLVLAMETAAVRRRRVPPREVRADAA